MVFLLCEKAVFTILKKSSSSLDSKNGVAETSKCTTEESTFGGGENTFLGTLNFNSGLVYICSEMERTPYSLQFGEATILFATSF